jgi:hypothetical protein
MIQNQYPCRWEIGIACALLVAPFGRLYLRALHYATLRYPLGGSFAALIKIAFSIKA